MSLIVFTLNSLREQELYFYCVSMHQQEDSSPSQKFLNTTTSLIAHCYFFTAPITKGGRERGQSLKWKPLT